MTDGTKPPRVRRALDWPWILERLAAWTEIDQRAIQVHCVLRNARDAQDWQTLYEWVVAQGRAHIPAPVALSDQDVSQVPPVAVRIAPAGRRTAFVTSEPPPVVDTGTPLVSRAQKRPALGPVKAKVERAAARIGHRMGAWEEERHAGQIPDALSRCTACGAEARICGRDGQILMQPNVDCRPAAIAREDGPAQLDLFG